MGSKRRFASIIAGLFFFFLFLPFSQFLAYADCEVVDRANGGLIILCTGTDTDGVIGGKRDDRITVEMGAVIDIEDEAVGLSPQNAEATGIDAGKGDDEITNFGTIGVSAEAIADSGTISVGVEGNFEGEASSRAGSAAIGIEGGKGDDEVVSTGTITVGATATAAGGSITVGNGDNTDFFVEKLNPDNPDQYLTEEGYRNFEIVNETLKIKGKDGVREETLKVKISRHGPVISDIMTGMPQNCTMMWPGLLGHDGTLEGLLGCNRARNFGEFRKALSVVRGGSVHIGYADINGNIGYQYTSTLPIRKSGQNPVPRPGDRGEYDWTGYLPFEDHPYALNPDTGYVASFNQMPERGIDYGTAYFLFERPYRFEEMVRSKEKFSPEDVRKMQTDVGSNLAKRWAPHILRVCGSTEGLSQYAASLRNWDCAITLDSPQATLFNSFFTHLMTNTLENKVGKKVMDEMYADLHVSIPAQWLIRSMDDNNHWTWDDPSTPNLKETRDDMILKSLRDAVSELTGRLGKDQRGWAWGKVHTMTIKHPMGGILPFLNLSPIPYPGDDFTINAGWWDRQKPYDMTSGAAIRIVVDMSNLGTMTLMSPPGQSGHYLSPYYSDLVDLWAKGEQIPAHYTDAESLKQLLVLQPSGVR